MATRAVLPKVQLTQVFRNALLAEGADPEVLVDAFALWKEDWPKYEDLDEFFGKDADYHTPTRSGKRVLRHVHMPPEDPNNWPLTAPPLSPEEHVQILGEIQRWDSALHNKRAARYRTSSRVLVYADGGRHGYLLLHLAREPNGHDSITANKQLMSDLADVADAFIFNGAIII